MTKTRNKFYYIYTTFQTAIHACTPVGVAAVPNQYSHYDYKRQRKVIPAISTAKLVVGIRCPYTKHYNSQYTLIVSNSGWGIAAYRLIFKTLATANTQ